MASFDGWRNHYKSVHQDTGVIWHTEAISNELFMKLLARCSQGKPSNRKPIPQMKKPPSLFQTDTLTAKQQHSLQ